jgi:hypothetical protein
LFFLASSIVNIILSHMGINYIIGAVHYFFTNAQKEIFAYKVAKKSKI